MRARSQITCPRHDKYPGGGSETFSVQAALLHIWRCRHEYNPPLTPLPTKLILPLVSSPSLLATRQTFILCFARKERERDCPPNHHGSFSPSFVSPMFEWVPLYSWLPSTWDDGNFSPPLCSQFSRMIARGLKGSLEVGVFFYLLSIFCFKMKDNTRE